MPKTESNTHRSIWLHYTVIDRDFKCSKLDFFEAECEKNYAKNVIYCKKNQ